MRTSNRNGTNTMARVGSGWSVSLNSRPSLYLLFGKDYLGLNLRLGV